MHQASCLILSLIWTSFGILIDSSRRIVSAPAQFIAMWFSHRLPQVFAYPTQVRKRRFGFSISKAASGSHSGSADENMASGERDQDEKDIADN
jgi:hypothetical protein